MEFNGENSIQPWPVGDKEVKSFVVALALFNWPHTCTFIVLHCFGPPLFSAHFSCSLFAAFWVAPHCSFIYQRNSAAAVFYTRHGEIHNLRRKTMSAGRLLLASYTPLCSVILAALKEKLRRRTYSITFSLALPWPPENWISAVVLCDVAVPDKSLTSICTRILYRH